jgi:hypothetical protein
MRAAFFERLHKESGQNLKLALFLWLRSIDFENSTDVITIKTVRTLSVDFLNDLDLRSAFSLKAVLFHLTLTLEEHNRLFRVTERQGTVLMESLLNSGLIVPVGRPEAGAQARIETTKRYRVHPLLIHPVVENLRGRHIIY